MVSGTTLFLGLFNNLAIFIVLIAVYSFLVDSLEKATPFNKQIAMGCAFGFFAICCMHVKIPVAEGVIVDQRNAIVALSGIFGGPLSALLSAVFAAAYRIYLGGEGILGGSIGIGLAALAGIGLHQIPEIKTNAWKAALGAFAATILILPGFIFIRNISYGWELTKKMAVPYGSAIFLGIYFVGLLLAWIDRLHQVEIIQKLTSERLRDFAESASDWFWEMDEEFRFRFISDRYEEITRLKIADQLGSRLWDGDAENETSDKWIPLQNTLSMRRPFKDYEYARPNGDGSLLYIQISGLPVFDASGAFRGYRGCATDVTKRKLAEEERKKLQDQLTQSQKMESVGRLAGGVAHDFNNMLGVILGHAELALKKIENKQSIDNDLKEIEKAAQRSADLTRQLLAFARKQTIAPKTLDLNKAIEGLLKMLRRLIGEDILLSWFPGSNLGYIRLDPSQIDQIMANLCVNARDAITGVGAIAIETLNVVFREEDCAGRIGYRPGEYVMLAVSDNGCGMDKDTQEKIFEPFFTTKKIGQGTGLGLATVFGVVKQNDGFINVYSEPGKGSTFRIYFPCIEENKEDVQEIKPEETLRGAGETILLVEDELMILELGQTMLEMLGYRVLATNAPDKAIQLAKEHGGEIHLLITDVVMPGMNGRDLSNQLLGWHPNLKKLFISGYTANVIAHQGVLDAGVLFLPKPFSVKELSAKVQEALTK